MALDKAANRWRGRGGGMDTGEAWTLFGWGGYTHRALGQLGEEKKNLSDTFIYLFIEKTSTAQHILQ